jgi:hypothetical protein
MDLPGHFRELTRRRISGADGPNFNRHPLAGPLEDQAAAGEHSVIKMGRDEDPAHMEFPVVNLFLLFRL